VRTSNSTPLLANIRHMPLMIPEKLAYEIASKIRVRFAEAVGSTRRTGEDDGFRSNKGVCSVATARVLSVTPVVSAAGVSRGDRGGVGEIFATTSFREKEYSMIWV
jgi:hypothetical protein